jgi:hypothetical protein
MIKELTMPVLFLFALKKKKFIRQLSMGNKSVRINRVLIPARKKEN